MIKLSRKGITTLKRMYKSVLLKCLLINAGIMLAAGNAMAADTWAGAITETTQFMDGLAAQGWDRNDGNVTGWGVDQILGKMEDAATNTDAAVSLVNDGTKGNEALYNALQDKADASTVEALSGTVAGHTTAIGALDTAISAVNTALGSKANSADVYTKTEIDTTLADYAKASDLPTKTSELTNDSGFITSEALSDYVAKEEGKGLSSNDFTTAEKNKLDGIEAGAQVNVIETIKVDGTALEVTGKTVNIDLSGKQDNLAIETGSGLNMGTDGKTLTVLAGDGLELTNSGVGIKEGGVTNDMLHSGSLTVDKFKSGEIDSAVAEGSGHLITSGAVATYTKATVKDAIEDAISYDATDNEIDFKVGSTTFSAYDKTGTDNAIADAIDSAISYNNSTGQYTLTTSSGSGNVYDTTATDNRIKELAEEGNYSGTQVNGGTSTTTISGALSATNQQVDTNTAAIELLNDGEDVVGSVRNTVKTGAENATYTAASTGAVDLTGNGTIGGALQILDANKASTGNENTFTEVNTFEQGIIIGDGSTDHVRVTINSDENGLTVDKDLTVGGDLTAANGTFTVTEEDGIAYNNVFSVDAEGNTNISGDLGVAGDANVTGGLTAANGTFTVTEEDGLALGTNKFTVDKDGNTTVAGTFAVQEDALVVDEEGDVSMSGDLAVTGDVSADNVKASEGLEVGEDGAYLKVDENGTTVGGDFKVGDNFSVNADDGSFSAAGGAFSVNENGSIAAANNGFVVNKDGNITKAGTISAADGKFLVKEGGAVSAAAGTFIVYEGGLVTAAAGKFQIKENGALSTAGGHLLVDEEGNLSTDGNANVKGRTTTTELAFADNEENYVNTIDVGEEGILTGEGSANAMATTATVAKTVGDIAGMDNKAITDKSDVASAINSLADSIEGALGGAFQDDGTWNSGDLSAEEGASYGTLTATTVTGALQSLNSTIGTATTSGINGVDADATINENIDAVNNIIGDVSKLNTENRNLTNGTDRAPKTVVEALNNIDATLGTIHGLAEKRGADYKGNLAEGTTVEMHLSALDDAIGDRSTITNENGSNGYKFSSDTMYVADVLSDVASQIGTAEDLGTAMNGVSADNTVNSNIASLNESLGDLSTLEQTHYASDATNVADAIKGVDRGLYKLDHDVRSLRSHFEAGMASAAALSALVPNARAHGNTQLSLGTGAYRGHNAVALGGFHWINDNVLLNAGVAWDNTEATYRVGVTYSW